MSVATMTTRLLVAAVCALGLRVDAAEPAQLTRDRDNITDESAALDRRYFDSIADKVRLLEPESSARAAAETWLLAARTEYEGTNRSAFVGEAAARARGIAASPTGLGAPSSTDAHLEAYEAWIAERRKRVGFRAALPLIEAAERLGRRPSAPAIVDARPVDLPDRVFAIQQKLAALHDVQGMLVGSYAWARAQAWLDFAIDEHRIRDRSGVVTYAADQAAKLVEQLEQAQDTPMSVEFETLHFAKMPRVRPDLWAKVARTPLSATRARLEIALAQLAYAHARRGHRAARPYERAAERLAATLEENAKP